MLEAFVDNIHILLKEGGRCIGMNSAVSNGGLSPGLYTGKSLEKIGYKLDNLIDG